MKIRNIRRHLLILAVIALGVGFIGMEVYDSSRSVRLVFIGGAERIGADKFLLGKVADNDIWVRAEAQAALVRRGEKAVPALLEILEDPEPKKNASTRPKCCFS